MHDLITYLSPTHIFESYVVRIGFKDGYSKDMCSKEIGLHAHNILTILDSTINVIGEPYMTI